jgi:hypothetical protein
VNRSNSAKALAVGLGVYVVVDLLLTPLGQLETRPVSGVTGIGFATLGLLFAGLLLALFALVLLYRRSRRAFAVAIVAAALYFPAPLVELAGLFSRFRPPTAIARLELAQAVVAIVVIGLAAWALRGSPSRPAV